MAKYAQLIRGDDKNWEVAAFLLIDRLYVSSLQTSRIEFSRIDMHSSTRSLNFIEELLGPIGYVVDNTLSNSISSAITRLEQDGYMKREDDQCILTNTGLKRLAEIKSKYKKGNEEPIGSHAAEAKAFKAIREEAEAKAFKAIRESDLPENQKDKIIKQLKNDH